LTDDLIGCGQLVGLSRDQVIALLGQPDFQSNYKGRTFLDYDIGPERDSFFQIDSEVLSVEIGASGLFARAEIYQS
jgi:outer membrane protein assembly factor BamE (lipoprotein component of BamABCDE complex)